MPLRRHHAGLPVDFSGAASAGTDGAGAVGVLLVDPARAPTAHHDPLHPRLPQVLHAQVEDQPDLQVRGHFNVSIESFLRWNSLQLAQVEPFQSEPFELT